MANYIVFVHGIGPQQPGYSSSFSARLAQAFGKEYFKAYKQSPTKNELVFEECYWADITQPDEQELIKRLGERGELHKLMLGSVGGAIAYSKLEQPPDRYTDIQNRFESAIMKISQIATAV